MIPFPLPPAPPAFVRVQATSQTPQAIAPHAGAPGQSEAAGSSAPPGRTAAASDNGGALPSKSVPGGTNHAPDVGPKPGSFSKPIDK